MSDDEKPFSCGIEGCEMTFSNEDHLNWHQKKHDIILNLSLANKTSETSDQTPTPTRFIRNCEEVGLFQDLQNVNPFDETFKKAIEGSKCGGLTVPSANDDTLHTPNIFPRVEDNVGKFVNAADADTESGDFCIITDNSAENKKPEQSKLKSKLKESIINKEKCKNDVEKLSASYKVVNSKEKRVLQQEENDENSKRTKRKVTENNDEKSKIREMNRAAQFRCRKRKKMQLGKMEDNLNSLKSENSKLLIQNQIFKHKFNAIKQFIAERKNEAALETSSQILSKIEKILDDPLFFLPPNSGKINQSPPTVNKVVPILPSSSQKASAKPVLIKVDGPVAQLAISVCGLSCTK